MDCCHLRSAEMADAAVAVAVAYAPDSRAWGCCRNSEMENGLALEPEGPMTQEPAEGLELLACHVHHHGKSVRECVLGSRSATSCACGSTHAS